MYGMTVDDINLAAVFGVALGIYLVTIIEVVAREAVTFIKGWRK